ncbi:hypothetical protein GCM10023074_20240 [Microbispora amethystogenes]|uniref:Uncharacterized protein n=1 Tax=Microbispora amethystogenes TaxID=1427754 RepID=A0ABQ4FC16_9ACTN|nr:hypothetical protein Mam01_25250 [Microbispora amethystogenes]
MVNRPAGARVRVTERARAPVSLSTLVPGRPEDECAGRAPGRPGARRPEGRGAAHTPLNMRLTSAVASTP